MSAAAAAVAGVEIRQLRKRFGDHDAVDGVDLSIQGGELLVLLGPSGCGKTTLLRMIAGLEHPSAGEIYIGGRRMDRTVPPRARGIAMVFQSYALYPHRTVFGNIAFPLEAARLPRAAIAEKVRWAADLFGITRYLERFPRQLSGGERQRVALCRALVRDPQVFLLDEPLANLDAKLRNTARDELKRFQRQIKRTTVYVTHDQVEALGLGDRIAVMDRGRVRQVGTPQQVYEDPVDTFVATFLGQPPMNLIEHEGGTLLGFRPEDLLPRDHFGGREALHPVPLIVRRVEYLGSDRYVYGTVETAPGAPGATVIAKLPANVGGAIPEAEGVRLDFAVPERALCYFDAATGARVRGGEGR
jgi:multiple sugar transport system ATP-binding protein